MSADYQYDRVVKQIEDIKKEQSQLVHSLMRTKRDEQFEVERLKREFAAKISTIENRQGVIKQSIRVKEKELVQMESRRNLSGSDKISEIEEAKQRRRKALSR